MGEMMTLGELRAATAGMDGDLCLDFAFDLLGKTVHCAVVSVRRVDDPFLGFDEAVFELSLDPDIVAGDDALMSELNERSERLKSYYELIGG